MKENKSLKKVNIILTIVAVIMVISGTFAWLKYRSDNTAMELTVGNINNVQITLKPYQLNLKLTPMLTYTDLDTSGDYITVKVTNNGNDTENFQLYYDIDVIDSGLQNSNFKYTIVRTNDNQVTEGNFASANTNNNFYILNGTIPSGVTHTYKVYLWLYGSNSNAPGLTFKGDLRASIG